MRWLLVNVLGSQTFKQVFILFFFQLQWQEPLMCYSQARSDSQLIIHWLFEKWIGICLSHNQCQIQICIPVCVMDSEYFMITSLYLVRLKIFEWIKLLQRNSHQIPGNRAGRNFITTSCVNSPLITHAECWGESEVYNYQKIQLLNDKFVNGIFRVCLTVNNTEVDCSFLWTNALT